MSNKSILLVMLVIMFALSSGSVAAQGGGTGRLWIEPPTQTDPSLPQPDGIAAFHRSGQTFITWHETDALEDEFYVIYRHTEPINADNIDLAVRIATVPQGSSIFWTERGREAYEESGYHGIPNYVITDLGEPLPDDTGLFVWTATEDGDFYYAVTTARGEGENRLTFGTGNSLMAPVSERVERPRPVLVYLSPDGLSRVYTHWMDYARYNPTFDVPRDGNGWFWLDVWEDPLMSRAQQYAYNYWVGLPDDELCGGPVPETLPLILHIEGWGSRYEAPPNALYWCAVHVWADDPSQSWYFGFSATFDYRVPEGYADSGPVVNYTEERLLRTIAEVMSNPDLPRIDPNRIYAYGHSMGGTGALMLAERYPNVFAAVFANQPMMDYGAAEMWVDELEAKWGPRALNLPIEIRGEFAAHLTRYNGTGVWDWQNLGRQLAARRGDEMAYITILHGTADTVVDWETVVRPSYVYFYEGRRAFAGLITTDDHTWVGFIDPPSWAGFGYVPFRRDESIPALSYASGSLPTPPDGPGGYNMNIEWSASWNDFAGPPEDTVERWAVVLRTTDGSVQTVDVTPRRLQTFEVEPGAEYRWRNERLDGSVVAEGTVVADGDGLITVTGFAVDGGGNRLVIER